jgi:hypothetical protein
MQPASLEQKRTKRIIQASPLCSITSTASHIKACTEFDIQQLKATPAINSFIITYNPALFTITPSSCATTGSIIVSYKNGNQQPLTGITTSISSTAIIVTV